MIELSTVMSELRRELHIAPGGEVPGRLVADALTQRLASQPSSTDEQESSNETDGQSADPTDPTDDEL